MGIETKALLVILKTCLIIEHWGDVRVWHNFSHFFWKASNTNLFFSSMRQNNHLWTSDDDFISPPICVYTTISQHYYHYSSWKSCFVWQLVIMQNMTIMESVVQCVIQVSPTVLHLIATTDEDEVIYLKGSYDLSGFKLSQQYWWAQQL